MYFPKERGKACELVRRNVATSILPLRRILEKKITITLNAQERFSSSNEGRSFKSPTSKKTVSERGDTEILVVLNISINVVRFSRLEYIVPEPEEAGPEGRLAVMDNCTRRNVNRR